MERFSASQASKFMNCRASANLDLAIPNWVPPEIDPNADNAANRGTKMHELFAGVMDLSTKDIEMMSKALMYVAHVRKQRRFKVLIEATAIANWLPSSPSTQADLVLYVADEIHVFDLKTGTIPVSAVENHQLLFYAITYGPLAPKAKGVYMHIVQPWADVMEVWFADTVRLEQFMRDAQTTDLQIRQGSTVFTPGDHCQFCPANPHGRGAKGRPYCPAMMELLYPQPLLDYDEILKGD